MQQPRGTGLDDGPVDQVEAAVRILRDSGVVAVPTDTLYGLAASALDVSAVRRIFRIKGRSQGMALPLLLADASDMAQYAAEVPDAAWALAEAFLPGALTLVLIKSPDIPDAITGGLDTIALRVPDHDVPRRIARRLGHAITGTSANRSGAGGNATAEEVTAELGEDVDLVIDGGRRPAGAASTIIDLTTPVPQVLREGVVSGRAIEDVLL